MKGGFGKKKKSLQGKLNQHDRFSAPRFKFPEKKEEYYFEGEDRDKEGTQGHDWNQEAYESGKYGSSEEQENEDDDYDEDNDDHPDRRRSGYDRWNNDGPTSYNIDDSSTDDEDRRDAFKKSNDPFLRTISSSSSSSSSFASSSPPPKQPKSESPAITPENQDVAYDAFEMLLKKSGIVEESFSGRGSGSGAGAGAKAKDNSMSKRDHKLFQAFVGGNQTKNKDGKIDMTHVKRPNLQRVAPTKMSNDQVSDPQNQQIEYLKKYGDKEFEELLKTGTGTDTPKAHKKGKGSISSDQPVPKLMKKPQTRFASKEDLNKANVKISVQDDDDEDDDHNPQHLHQDDEEYGSDQDQVDDDGDDDDDDDDGLDEAERRYAAVTGQTRNVLDTSLLRKSPAPVRDRNAKAKQASIQDYMKELSGLPPTESYEDFEALLNKTQDKAKPSPNNNNTGPAAAQAKGAPSLSPPPSRPSAPSAPVRPKPKPIPIPPTEADYRQEDYGDFKRLLEKQEMQDTGKSIPKLQPKGAGWELPDQGGLIQNNKYPVPPQVNYPEESYDEFNALLNSSASSNKGKGVGSVTSPAPTATQGKEPMPVLQKPPVQPKKSSHADAHLNEVEEMPKLKKPPLQSPQAQAGASKRIKTRSAKSVGSAPSASAPAPPKLKASPVRSTPTPTPTTTPITTPAPIARPKPMRTKPVATTDSENKTKMSIEDPSEIGTPSRHDIQKETPRTNTNIKTNTSTSSRTVIPTTEATPVSEKHLELQSPPSRAPSLPTLSGPPRPALTLPAPGFTPPAAATPPTSRRSSSSSASSSASSSTSPSRETPSTTGPTSAATIPAAVPPQLSTPPSRPPQRGQKNTMGARNSSMNLNTKPQKRVKGGEEDGNDGEEDDILEF